MNDEKRRALAMDACLKSIAAGHTLEEALSAYPDLANEIRPELEAAVWLHQRRSQASAIAFNPVPGKLKLESQLRAQHPNWAQAFTRARWTNGVSQAVSLFLVLFMLVQVASSINRAARVTIPGDLLYSVKLLGEQSQILFTPQIDQKTALYIDFTRQRSSEMVSLFFENRVNYIAPTAARLKASAAAADDLLNDPEMRDGPETDLLKQRLQQVLDTHQLAILTLPSILPPQERAEAVKQLTP